MPIVSKEELFGMVGQTIGTSEWMLIDQDRVNKFAEATGDFQFIHVDPERAKLTPFGGPIAHGFLSLSLLPVLTAQADLPRLDGVKMGVNYGGNKTRFIAPVKVGKRVRGHFKMLDIEESAPANSNRRWNSRWRSRARISLP
jgi:acyl dehydratase